MIILNYYKNRSINKINAANHANKMNSKYAIEIQQSISRTEKYAGKQFIPRCDTVLEYDNIQVVEMTTEQYIMIMKPNGKVAALNFASYKKAGGMFLEGSMAQEEALCHHSTLYNVLSGYDSIFNHYKTNMNDLNRGLYRDICLYSPDIIFDNGFKCDIITCAAPNLVPVLRYKTATMDEIYSVLYSRCKFILEVAVSNHVDTLILGAFGCGVFKNNPHDVANIFKSLLYNENYRSYFKQVIFAIPTGENYDVFNNVFRR